MLKHDGADHQAVTVAAAAWLRHGAADVYKRTLNSIEAKYAVQKKAYKKKLHKVALAAEQAALNRKHKVSPSLEAGVGLAAAQDAVKSLKPYVQPSAKEMREEASAA